MKQEKNSIKTNFLMNVLLTLSTFIFPLITFPYVSRVLTPIGTGKVAMATSFVQYFVMFAQLGLPTYGIRAVAKVRDDREKLTKTVHELLIISTITSIIAYVILFICIPTIPRISAEKPLYYIMSANIFLNCIGMEWMYKGLEQYTYITVRSIIFKFIALVLMFVFIHNQSDYLIYGVTSVVASSLSYVLNFINAKKYIDMKWLGNYDIRPHLKAVAIFLAMAIATTVYTHLDTVMLGFMTTDVDIGYYNAAVKIKTVLVSMVTALGAVLLPRASYYVETKQMVNFRIIAAKALDFVFVAAIPVTVFFIYFARQGIMLLSGDAYMGAIQPMQLLMPTTIFIGITNILGIQILVPLGKERAVLHSEILGAVVDLVLNFILIPRYAASGAAIGTLVAEFCVLIYQAVVLREEVKPMLKKISYSKILFAATISLAATFWIPALGLRNFFTLAIAGIIYFGLYLGYLILRKEPIALEALDFVLKKLKVRREEPA
ncbi:MAG: flippase [Clostridia bacterium]|nr:flippase [Clostridia bacterium]